MIHAAISHARRSRLPRRVAILALLGPLLLAACGTAASPTPPAATPRPTPRPAATPSEPSPVASLPAASPTPMTDAACAMDDIEATSQGWGGGAGSLGADVTVHNRGPVPCFLPATPAVALFDAGGTVVLQSPPRLGDDLVVLNPSGAASFSFQFSNWCDESVALPVHVAVALANDAAGIDGLAVAAIADLPQCIGPGQPAEITTTDWVLG
jgi:hypothetical protein